MSPLLDLTTLPWTLVDPQSQPAGIPATLPGCVHTALAARGLVPDFHTPDAEKACAWIGERDWIYRTDFEAPTAALAPGAVPELVAEGVDTLASVFLNDQLLGRCDNAFRTWRLPIPAGALRAGVNRLEFRLASPLRERDARKTTVALRDGIEVQDFVTHFAWLRRMACNHGWDWGPAFPTLGLGSVRIESAPRGRLGSVRLTQTHHADGDVTLDLLPEATGLLPGASFVATLSRSGAVLAETRGAGPLSLRASRPALWWPHDLGEPVLHELTVELHAADGSVVDTWSRRVGFRTIRLVQPPDTTGLGRGFHFEVNGRPFFAKGANWIPADLFPHRVTADRLRGLLRSAVGMHMNMLRVWGGGIYESDTFYDLCDELGLLVWQDFMFACAIYPAWDDAFLANVRAEAVDQVRRLRHHACLAHWCGNNEIEHNFVGERWAHEKRLWTERVMGRADYDRLFRATLGGAVAEHDPAAGYTSASPHDPADPARWPIDICGDNHYWDAWFWGVGLAAQRSSRHRFVSEFGFQSMPSEALLARLGAQLDAPPDDPVNARLRAHHQRCHGGDAMLARYAIRECGSTGATLRAFVGRTQLVQGLALKYAIEHWRASFGRTRGALIWQLNDIWPAVSWSLIDSDGAPKPACEFLRRSFAPVLVTGFEEPSARTVRIVAVNDRLTPLAAILRWTARATADDRVFETRDEGPFTVPPDGASWDLGTVELLQHAHRNGGPAQVYLHFELRSPDGTELLAENAALLVPPGEWAAARPAHAPTAPAPLQPVLEALRVV